MAENLTFAEHYLSNLAVELRKLKTLADRAVAQVGDDDLFAALDPESNSLAVLLQHLSGSLRSRFTDFLSTDGEKPDRHRDGEFEVTAGAARGDVLARWEEGWRRLLESVESLAAADLGRTVTIRSEPHTVLQALQRAFGHCAYHCGQIVLLAKHARSSDWQTLSVPRGKSEALNQKMAERNRGTTEVSSRS